MSRAFGFLSLSFAAVLWGSSFIAGKIALESFSFPFLVAVRFLISGAFLVVVLLRLKAPLREAFSAKFILLGFLTVTATFLLQFGGLSLTSAVNAAVVIGFEPMVVPLVGAIFFKEKFPVSLAGLSVVATGGVALTIGSPTPGGWWGILLVLTSTVVVGFWIFLTKRLMADRKPVVATGLVTWGGLASLLPSALLLSALMKRPVVVLGGDLGASALAALFLGLFCTLGASFLWNWGLNRVSGGFSGIFLALEPLVGVLLAVLILGEPFTWKVGLGTSLVLASAVAAVFVEHTAAPATGPGAGAGV